MDIAKLTVLSSESQQGQLYVLESLLGHLPGQKYSSRAKALVLQFVIPDFTQLHDLLQDKPKP